MDQIDATSYIGQYSQHASQTFRPQHTVKSHNGNPRSHSCPPTTTINLPPSMSSSALEEPDHNYRRTSCDDLLAASRNEDSESDHEVEGILGRSVGELRDDELAPAAPVTQRKSSTAALKRRAFFIRTIALLCACCLSVGSHYASYVLGPLKSRLSRELGTSHTEFSLLISAFSLNSTWTPLLGGVLASSLGTTFTSILATGIIFLGQIILLIGDIAGSIRMMAFGMFIFGVGVSPVAVVQETIIVRFFKSHGLGVSMAFGLIVGKGASFVSARTSYPLTEMFGPRAPFYAATTLAGMSVVVNLVYIAASRWLVDGAGAELEAADITEEARRRSITNVTEAEALERVAAKRRVNLREVTKLGDVFWSYVGLNILCGAIWSPFTHLAANIIENRYGMSEQDAANEASYLLAGSLLFYPICGFLVDRLRHRPIVVQLLLLSSCLTLSAYGWLVLPPSWTQTARPAIAAFAVGHGFSPLLLVVLVPKIVPLKYVSTALGVHKSLEQTGSTIFQTLAGLALDTHKKGHNFVNRISQGNTAAIQYLLNIFFFLNVLQLLSIVALAYLQRRKNKILEAQHRRASTAFSREPSTDRGKAHSRGISSHSSDHEQETPLLDASQSHRRYSSSGSRVRFYSDYVRSKGEIRRGEVFVSLSAGLIVFAWVLFLGTAWFRLGMKKDHGST
ncbi:major facilitator superfamily domain-containing protein [Armillaria fumosa]|nr:major facilitator superfamily domain-containing protein [Armillaria fumosa]